MGFQTVALVHRALQLGLGGERWLNQFTYGFSIAGSISQEGLPPVGPGVSPSLPLSSVISDAAARFRTRSRSPGYLLQDSLWGEAADQVSKG